MRRAVGAALIAALLLAVSGCATEPSAAGSGASSTHVTTTVPHPQPGRQLLTMHGLTVEFPAAWPVDDEWCGVPQASTVLRPRDSTAACEASTDTSRMTWVDFNGPLWSNDDMPKGSTTSSRTIPPGITATVRHSPSGQRPVVVRLDVESRNLTMKVTGPTETDVDQILDSARFTDTDANGCPTPAEPTVDFPTGSGDPANFVPAGAVSARICRYSLGQIEQGAVLSGPPIDELVTELNRLPLGTFDAQAQTNVPVAQCERSHGVVVHRVELSYADGRDAEVVARTGLCGTVGVSNGMWSGRVTNQLRTVLSKAAGGGPMFEAGMIDAR